MQIKQELANVDTLATMLENAGIDTEIQIKKEWLPHVNMRYPINANGQKPWVLTVDGREIPEKAIITVASMTPCERFYDEENNKYISCIENPKSEKGIKNKESIELLKKDGQDVQQGVRCLVFICFQDMGEVVCTFAELQLFGTLKMYMMKHLEEAILKRGKGVMINIGDHSCNVKNGKSLVAGKFTQVTKIAITKDLMANISQTLENQKELVDKFLNW